MSQNIYLAQWNQWKSIYTILPPKMLLSLEPQFRNFKGKGVIFIPWQSHIHFPTTRHRKVVLRLLQVRQMDCCSSLKLCISRSTGQMRQSGCKGVTDQAIGSNRNQFRRLINWMPNTVITLTRKDHFDFFVYLKDTKKLAPITISNYKK